MRKRLIISSLAALAVPATAFAAIPGTTTGELHLRQGPSTDTQIIDTIPKGATVEIGGCLPARDWCRVVYNGETGWSSSNYLDALYNGSPVAVTNTEVHIPVLSAAANAVGALATGAANAVGAVASGAVNAVQAIVPPYNVNTYVTNNPVTPYTYNGTVANGMLIPASVKLNPIPNYSYDYTYVNNTPVLVDPDTRKVVKVY